MAESMYALPPRVDEASDVTGVSCPDCSGVLSVHPEGKRGDLAFECRVGHTHTVSGLIAIKKAGGLSLVQSPLEAQFESMPVAALAEDHVDAALAIDDLAGARVALARGDTIDAARPRVSP